MSRPWLLTCRHDHEAQLAREVAILRPGTRVAAPLCPGLVRVDGDLPTEVTTESLCAFDPTWAMQILPDAERLRAASIKGLAAAMAEPIAQWLDAIGAQTDDGPTWDLHAIVAGQLKGQPEPPMANRLDLVVEQLVGLLGRTRRRALRRRAVGSRELTHLVQVILVGPEDLWLSCSPVARPTPSGRWPAVDPAGLAPVADEPESPNSAFRKLREAFACMGVAPSPWQDTVDLGASPGGWTHVLRALGARVTAVDRSPLAPRFRRDPGVCFVRGDAFVYLPPSPVDWMVCDVIAYPERSLELIERWTAGHHARRLVVQLKFRGDPDHEAIATALRLGREHGYAARARHFFNDKNEATVLFEPADAAPAAAALFA